MAGTFPLRLPSLARADIDRPRYKAEFRLTTGLLSISLQELYIDEIGSAMNAPFAVWW